ncbi:hypothetical protein [Rickettsia australis]|uniref:Uncharacterized protein n=1 Tax=Rickettsia australis (strain Cutlack) TaxID=1105110 RepID=H8K8M6_RICAC|nr:hypothetical protein [Rickettsia australis]AFC71619.1 hypothetical protein MC5_06905 [Rickettsia australis str. Cutlack]
MTSYDGEVRVSGIEELIYHMYGVIGIIGSFPVLYKDEDTNIIRAVAPKRNSYKNVALNRRIMIRLACRCYIPSNDREE